MTCNACGEKPKNTARDFTKAVIEIDNPETLVLLRKVVIPVSMGTEEQVPPAIGKYHNVILYYEANKHVYIYSSDGIPTFIEVNIPEELLDRIDDLEDGLSELEQEFDDFKNSPDVVDIVATYAALQAYDTSKLGDNDIIRVLVDETHDDESTYYRWDKQSSSWTYIGATGPYYTKDETDEMILSATGAVRLLTEDDMNWNFITQSATEPYNGVALWLLPPGIYQKDSNTGLVRYSKTGNVSEDEVFIVGKKSTNGTPMLKLRAVKSTDGYGHNFYTSLASVFVDTTGSSISDGVWDIIKPADDLTTTAMNVPLAANQGKVLKDMIGDLSTLTTTAKTNLVSAINEVAASGGDDWTELTAADYNYPTNNPTSVASWKLADGKYKAASGVTIAPRYGVTWSSGVTNLIVKDLNGSKNIYTANSNYGSQGRFFTLYSNGTLYTDTEIELQLEDSVTSTSKIRALTANQGKILNDKITNIMTTLATYDARLQALEGGGVINPNGDDDGEEPIVVDDSSGEEPMPVPEP